MRFPSLLLLLPLWLTAGSAVSQPAGELRLLEDSLKGLGREVLYGKEDFNRYQANEKFLRMLETALDLPNSFDYPFDSVTTMSRLRPGDNTFRILTWNLPKSDGTFEYFGFLQYRNSDRKTYTVARLMDRSAEIMSPEQKTLGVDTWYGALYYKLIESEYGGRKYYTLLGWKGVDPLVSRKIIEVLSFRSNWKPFFGAPVFNKFKKGVKRVIFDYSSRSAMSLKYDEQSLVRHVRGRKSRMKSILVKGNMIVFDRLAPPDASLEGQYQFYYPETNVFDAFVFEKGKWVYYPDIDARNKSPVTKPKKRKAPELELFPKK